MGYVWSLGKTESVSVSLLQWACLLGTVTNVIFIQKILLILTGLFKTHKKVPIVFEVLLYTVWETLDTLHMKGSRHKLAYKCILACIRPLFKWDSIRRLLFYSSGLTFAILVILQHVFDVINFWLLFINILQNGSSFSNSAILTYEALRI